jgi:hypothetical protein
MDDIPPASHARECPSPDFPRRDRHHNEDDPALGPCSRRRAAQSQGALRTLGHADLSIAGLRCDGLTAPWVIDKPMNRATFELYIQTQLAPILTPGDVVIPATNFVRAETISPVTKVKKQKRS